VSRHAAPPRRSGRELGLLIGLGVAVVAAIGVVVATLKRDRQRLLGALQVAARGISRLL